MSKYSIINRLIQFMNSMTSNFYLQHNDTDSLTDMRKTERRTFLPEVQKETHVVGLLARRQGGMIL